MHRVHEIFLCIIQVFLIRPVINDSQESQRYKPPIFHMAEKTLMHVDLITWQVNMDTACEQYAAVHFHLSVRFCWFSAAFPQNVLHRAKLVFLSVLSHAIRPPYRYSGK